MMLSLNHQVLDQQLMNMDTRDLLVTVHLKLIPVIGSKKGSLAQ